MDCFASLAKATEAFETGRPRRRPVSDGSSPSGGKRSRPGDAGRDQRAAVSLRRPPGLGSGVRALAS